MIYLAVQHATRDLFQHAPDLSARCLQLAVRERQRLVFRVVLMHALTNGSGPLECMVPPLTRVFFTSLCDKLLRLFQDSLTTAWGGRTPSLLLLQLKVPSTYGWQKTKTHCWVLFVNVVIWQMGTRRAQAATKLNVKKHNRSAASPTWFVFAAEVSGEIQLVCFHVFCWQLGTR